MTDRSVIRRIRQKYSRLSEAMDRRSRRQWAATEAIDLGWGGVGTVSEATGLDRHAILAGTRELGRRNGRATIVTIPGRRGRKRLVQTDPGLPAALEALMNPPNRGPLLWTCQSTVSLAQELRRQNHPVSDRTVASLLREDGYRLLDKRRCNERSSHAERDAQFAYINAQVAASQEQGTPVIWVETKSKTLKDNARFTARSIARWWQELARRHFPKANAILIVADVGGSHAEPRRRWKTALRNLAEELKLTLEIRHLPPATAKWRKIQHCLRNSAPHDRRGRRSVHDEAIVHLIGPAEVSNTCTPATFNSEWNYALRASTI